MKRWPSEASVKFLVKLFSKSLRLVRRSLTPLPLWRAAHEEKLGKQGLCPAFPGRWGSCPLSHGCRRASSPEGRAKSRLPLWGALVPSGHRSALDRAGRRECPPVGGGEGKVLAAPSHGLCRSAGELPSQSPNGASSPRGGAKSRLPLWGRCPRRGRRGLREATFLVRHRPGKTLRCFPSFSLADAH